MVSKWNFICIFLVTFVSLSTAQPWWETSTAISLDQNNFFEKVGKDNKHYVIDFYSKQCFWCDRLAPEYQRLSDHYQGANPARSDIVIAKVNSPENQMLGYKFQIMQYPTVLFIKRGEPNTGHLFRSERTYDRIKDWIEQIAGPEEKPVVREPESVKEPEPVQAPEPVKTLEPEKKDVFLSHIDEVDMEPEPSVDSDNDDRKTKSQIEGAIDDKLHAHTSTDNEATVLSDCAQESLQSIYDQYLFAVSQKTAHGEDVTLIKTKLGNLASATPASHLFRDILFFCFGLIIGIGLYVTYKKVVAAGHMYTD